MTIDTADVQFAAEDGWQLGARLVRPATHDAVPGVVTVPASRHERDAWTQTANALAERGVVSLMLDIRGRGASRAPLPYDRMAPRQRQRVTLDVRAALSYLTTVAGVRTDRLAIVAEQDTASQAAAAIDTRGVVALTLVSPRGQHRIVQHLMATLIPVHSLASTEDREGLRTAVDAYLTAPETTSKLDVYRGLGIGITMASVQQFEHPDEERLEDTIATWLAARLI